MGQIKPIKRSDIPRQFTAYAIVGLGGTLLDLFLFWCLVKLAVWTSVAVTAAFFIATAAQFVANRNWSFRALHRPALAQAPVYAIVTFVNWLLALAIVETGVARFHLTPLAAKALSIPPVALAGFIANRYLTFGAGLRRGGVR